MKRLNPPNPTLLFNPPPELTPPAPAFPLNPSASTSSDRELGSSSCNNSTVAASKSNHKNTQMSTSKVSPIDIINLADENGDDDITFLYATPVSCNKGNSVNNAISVEQYSADRDLQFAIMASLRTPQTRWKRTKRKVIDLNLFPDADDNDDDDVQVLESSLLPKKPFSGPSITEKGQSSGGSNSETLTFMCEICVDQKPQSESFSIMGCDHAYCSDCMIKYVASKLQENIAQIRCPDADCIGLLEPEHCRSILPQEVFDRWGSALCEAVILASEKFYCPFNDCSALLIDDGEAITQSECPNCKRLFCAQCKVPWHLGIECAEFQKLNKDERGIEDILLMNLAKEKKWIRCPLCKFYVEKSQGCLFMRCRCGHTFCYNCGNFLKDHYCTKCKR